MVCITFKLYFVAMCHKTTSFRVGKMMWQYVRVWSGHLSASHARGYMSWPPILCSVYHTDYGTIVLVHQIPGTFEALYMCYESLIMYLHSIIVDNYCILEE